MEIPLNKFIETKKVKTAKSSRFTFNTTFSLLQPPRFEFAH